MSPRCLLNTVGILLAKFLNAASITGVRRALGASRRHVLVWVATLITRPRSRVLRAVSDGIVSMRDHDFSVSIRRISNDAVVTLWLPSGAQTL
jgi:hypothetical protein